MHPLGLATAHLVPIVAREFELGTGRKLDLGQGREVLEPRFPCDLLGQEPLHIVHGRRFGEPREQRVALAGSRRLQVLEPDREARDVCGGLGGPVPHGRAFPLQKLAFDALELRHLLYVFPPTP